MANIGLEGNKRTGLGGARAIVGPDTAHDLESETLELWNNPQLGQLGQLGTRASTIGHPAAAEHHTDLNLVEGDLLQPGKHLLAVQTLRKGFQIAAIAVHRVHALCA